MRCDVADSAEAQAWENWLYALPAVAAVADLLAARLMVAVVPVRGVLAQHGDFVLDRPGRARERGGCATRNGEK